MARKYHPYSLILIGVSAAMLSCTSLTEVRDKKELRNAIAEKSEYDAVKERRIEELHNLKKVRGGRPLMAI